jgi:O-antigen ligase
MGYPLENTGKPVVANTYERVAWAVSGLTILLPEHPLGIGILKNTFSSVLKEKFPKSAKSITGSHSAWVDIALAFGIPGLLLTLGALVTLLYASVSFTGAHHYLIRFLSLGLISLYTVGEVSSQHAIEMLCFLIALMASSGLGKS